MQSKNVLWLGILFTLLLTTFCITKYINEFHMGIETVQIPQLEILDKNLKTTDTYKPYLNDNDAYQQIVKFVGKEDKNIEEIFRKAIEKEQEKIRLNKLKVEIAKIQPQRTVQKPKVVPKKPKKLTVETVLYYERVLLEKTLELSSFEKSQLKELAQIANKNRLSFLRIESKKLNKKIYLVKRYLIKLGILPKDIHIVHNKYKNGFSIADMNPNFIDISIIKKD